MTETWRDLLYRCLVVAAWVALGLMISILVSFIAVSVNALFTDGVGRLGAARAALWGRSSTWWTVRWQRFWVARRQEPREPVMRGLEALRGAVEGFGVGERVALERLVGRLEAEGARLRTLVTPADGGVAAEASPTWSRPRATLAGILATLVATLLLGGLNAFLLNIFFRETLGAYRLLPYPLPNLQASLLIAILFFLFEVFAGFALHSADSHRRCARQERAALPAGDPRHAAYEPTAADALKRWAPWVALLALLLVEVAAYSVLSVRINLPDILHITPDNAFFGAIRYLFALLGAGITLILAVCGHTLAEKIEAYQESRAERAFRQAVARGRATAASQAERTRQELDAIRRACDGLGLQAVAGFQDGVTTVADASGVLQAERSVGVVDALLVAVQRGAFPWQPGGPIDSGPESPPWPMRTPQQVWGDLFVHLLAGGVLAVLVALTAAQALVLVPGRGGVAGLAIAWATALALPLTTVVLAVLTRNALRGLRYAMPMEATLPHARPRTWAGTVYAGALVVLVLVFALFSVRAGVFGGGIALNAAAGAVIGIGVAALGMLIDSILVHVGHAALILWLGIVYGATALGCAVTVVAAIALQVATFALRLIAIPGDVVRRLRGPRPAYLPPTVAN